MSLSGVSDFLTSNVNCRTVLDGSDQISVINL